MPPQRPQSSLDSRRIELVASAYTRVRHGPEIHLTWKHAYTKPLHASPFVLKPSSRQAHRIGRAVGKFTISTFVRAASSHGAWKGRDTTAAALKEPSIYSRSRGAGGADFKAIAGWNIEDGQINSASAAIAVDFGGVCLAS